MNTNRKKATPLFVIGGFCLILFITIASAIATESNWVARFDLSWIEKIRGGIQPDKTAIVKFLTTLGKRRNDNYFDYCSRSYFILFTKICCRTLVWWNDACLWSSLKSCLEKFGWSYASS